MSPESASLATQLCPTCGTRLNEDAKRCLVCGSELGSAEKPSRAAKTVTGSRMPEITLSIPAAIALLALFLTAGAMMVFFALRSRPEMVAAAATITNTATLTLTSTVTPTDAPPTATHTPEPSPTPIMYEVRTGETCSQIAVHFQVSIEAIRQENNLNMDCGISPGQRLNIPQPTSTPTQLPTATLNPLQQTETACDRIIYEVQPNDTPNKIAGMYNVPWEAIKEENGLPGDSVWAGSNLVIPLCKRPTPQGPTATPSPLPPYPAPNLLLPSEGSPFTMADETITLQWASVGALKENEGYLVTVEHVTGGQGEKLVRFGTDTKLIVPSTFKPNDRNAHIYYWSVMTVRQAGTDSEGKPVYEPAGAASAKRSFSWSGSAGAVPSPTTP
jgi:LysM repeat protein